MTLLAQLNDSAARRSKSAYKIAAYIAADPESVLSMSSTVNGMDDMYAIVVVIDCN